MTATPNLPAKQPPKTQVMAGGHVAAIVPQSLDEAYRLASALAASGLAPKGFERPEQIMVAVMAGAELGLAPYQALQSFAVVNGRATMWGDSLVAVVRAQGCKIKTFYENESPDFPDAMTAVCEVTRPDGETVRAEFSVADAKRAKLWGKVGRSGEPTPWVTYPKRMLSNRARAYALRDGCADMLRGVQVREEVEEFDHVREVRGPAASGLRDRLTGPTTGEGFTSATAPEEPVEFAERAEEIAEAEFAPSDAEVAAEDDRAAGDDPGGSTAASESDFPGDAPATAHNAPDVPVEEWAGALARSLSGFDDVDELRVAWAARKEELKEANPALFRECNKAVADRAAEIATA